MKKIIIRVLVLAVSAVMLMAATGCGGSGDGTQTSVNQFNTMFPTTTNTPQASLPTTTQTPIPTTTTSLPTTTLPTGSAYAGTYQAQISQEALAQIPTEQQQQYLQYVAGISLVLDTSGSCTLTQNGTTGAGTWSDNGDGTITLMVNGNSLTWTVQNGYIFDPSDTSTYFQKVG